MLTWSLKVFKKAEAILVETNSTMEENKNELWVIKASDAWPVSIFFALNQYFLMIQSNLCE